MKVILITLSVPDEGNFDYIGRTCVPDEGNFDYIERTWWR